VYASKLTYHYFHLESIDGLTYWKDGEVFLLVQRNRRGPFIALDVKCGGEYLAGATVPSLNPQEGLICFQSRDSTFSGNTAGFKASNPSLPGPDKPLSDSNWSPSAFQKQQRECFGWVTESQQSFNEKRKEHFTILP
jgi:hypothetical protein